MKIVRQVEEVVIVENVDDIICNKCGRSCNHGDDNGFHGLIEATVCGGWGSKIGDMKESTFSICETCLIGMFREFVVPPRTRWGVGENVEQMAESICWILDCGHNLSVEQLRLELSDNGLVDEDLFVASMYVLEECGAIGPANGESHDWTGSDQ